MSTSSTAGSGTAQASSSVSAFVSTLVPVAAVAIISVTVFLLLRVKYRRVYQPRTFLPILRDEEKSHVLPPGKFSWINPFKNLPDEYILGHQSLDGFLYVRFLKIATTICFIGSCITFPVLFPVNATGGAGQTELDLLSFANISANNKNRYYAHVFIGWIFWAFVMYMITRETIYFINLRHAYMLSPFNAARISSRTVLFTDVPAEYQQQAALEGLFGNALRRSWLATDCKELSKLVEERDKDAMKLEGAEIKLSQKALKAKMKAEKKNKSAPAHSDTEAGQILESEWLNQKDRPTHRLGKIPLIGKKVDTIDWSRTELKRLIPEVKASQAEHKAFKAKLVSAVFVEFATQTDAQNAYRRMNPRRAPKMNPRAIATTPDQIVWKNIAMGAKQRMTRKFLANAFITLMIVFWAIPVAVVGAISNINYLTATVPFLSFINNCPTVILGLITGLLPSILLSVLMALVPIVCRLMAKLSGEVTLARVELKCQGWYMAFQVIQVFLVTTFASGAAAVVSGIINNPGSALSLLAENLPKASNFFISYIILQGLGVAASNLLNIGALVMIGFVGKFLDKSPRKMFKRYITLGGLGWGSLYPKIGNLLIIAITYSIIAPLVMGFATVGFGLLYIALRYNNFYVLTNSIDTGGLAYAKVLQQIITGVYLAQICLIGLFAINTSFGPLVLQIIALVATAIYHALMRQALRPLMHHVPESRESDIIMSKSDHKSFDYSEADGASPTALPPKRPTGAAAKLSGILSRIFNLRNFRSHSQVTGIVPTLSLPAYSQEEADEAYYNPDVISEAPVIWIVRDDLGIADRECDDNRDIIECSMKNAHFNEKAKVIWDHTDNDSLNSEPIWEKRVDY